MLRDQLQGMRRNVRRRWRAYGDASVTKRMDAFTVGVPEARRLAPAGELSDLFFAHDGRLVHKWVHYLDVYERYLGPLRAGFPLADGTTRPLRLLEIGVSHGGSLELWRKYLGPEAIIFGVDVDKRCAELNGVAGQVRIGSQADGAFLASVVEEMGGVDVVIDDGSHRASHLRTSYDVLFPLLSFGGFYLAEDLQTAYWMLNYDGGYRRPGTFIEVAKSLVDGMHGWYHRFPMSARAKRAQSEVGAVCFYDSIVVIEKRHHSRPAVVKVGHPTLNANSH